MKLLFFNINLLTQCLFYKHFSKKNRLQQQELLEDDIVSECSYEIHPISYKELLDNGRQERQEDMERDQEDLIKNLEEYATNLCLQGMNIIMYHYYR